MNQIPVFKPLIGPEELRAAADSLTGGWLGMGSSVGAFESQLESFLDLEDRHVVAVSTGHAALHLAMLLIGIGPGDEVITPSFNNIADLQAIAAVGGQPVFCDINPTSLCIDVDQVVSLIGPKTRAIIAMDYACFIADHAALREISDQTGIRIIHDAAHSFGSTGEEGNVGSYSDICMFSFDPVKTITCIDGGALVVRSQEEVEALHEMRLIGMGQPASVMYQNQRAWTYGVRRLGFRYHMPNLHAAIGMSQLHKIEEITESRRRACQLYSRLLESVDEVETPATSFEGVVPFLYFIRVPASSRSQLRDFLRARGIDTGIHWQPAHEFSLFSDAKSGDLAHTSRISREIVTLPLHSCMSPKLVQRISQAIADFYSL